MRLKKLIEECAAVLQEEAASDIANRDNSFGCVVDTNDGYIDLHYYKQKGKWLCEALVYHDHDNGNEHEMPNLEKYLSDALSGCVDWTVVEEQWEENEMDEYQRNGFASEADFWHWKEGY